jgi:trimethylamine--corrinoid protein Co-methyltransferase
MSRRKGNRGGTKARRERRDVGRLKQLPFHQVTNPYPPMEIASAEQIEAIHKVSLDVLEEIGMNFLLPEAREILKAAGAEVKADDPRVRFDRHLVEEKIKTAPSEFRMHARNPERDLVFGGGHMNFCAVGSPPNASDIEGGRRQGNFADYCDLLRLTHSLNIAHLTGGYPVEPTDIEPNVRHLEAVRALLKLTDKIGFGYSLGHRRILDAIEMTRIARGVSEDQLLREPSLYTVVNANSPLQYDRPMLWGMIEMARRNQPIVVTPFTLAGAMAPVTIPGALAQQNAEALAGIAFCQIVNPGAPVFYGGFTSNVDMKTGAPAFGTPEYAKAVLISGQLARRYRVPYRSSNVNASNHPDVQAAYESQISTWAVMLAHTNMVKHALGWLEGGLCASFEKLVIDAEILQNIAEFLRPVEISDATLGFEAIRDVGPGGHYFGTAHTLARFETAFYQPMLSDWRNFETWSEDGAVDATHRAHRIYKQLLADYEAPTMDPAVAEELDAFVERRLSQGGASAEE